jgi:hypothetical protein
MLFYLKKSCSLRKHVGIVHKGSVLEPGPTDSLKNSALIQPSQV